MDSSVSVLLWLDDMDVRMKFMVLVDYFSASAPDASKFLRELDHLIQMPKRVFFTLFGTPRDLSRIARMNRAVYEKLTVLKMPHFTFEEAREAIRRRVERAGLSVEELFPEDDLKAIYALSTGPRDMLNLAREYLLSGASIRAVVRSKEVRSVLDTIELLDETERAILSLIAAEGEVHVSRIKSSFPRLPESTLYYKLNRLMDRGLITRGERRGLYALTQLAESVRTEISGA